MLKQEVSFPSISRILFSITKKCTQMFKFCYHMSLKFEYKKLFIKFQEIKNISNMYIR